VGDASRESPWRPRRCPAIKGPTQPQHPWRAPTSLTRKRRRPSPDARKPQAMSSGNQTTQSYLSRGVVRRWGGWRGMPTSFMNRSHLASAQGARGSGRGLHSAHSSSRTAIRSLVACRRRGPGAAVGGAAFGARSRARGGKTVRQSKLQTGEVRAEPNDLAEVRPLASTNEGPQDLPGLH